MYTSRASFVCGCWVSEPSSSCLLSNYESPSSFLKTIYDNTYSHRQSLTKHSPRVQYNHSNIGCLFISTTFQVLNSIRPGQDVWGAYNGQKFIFIAECTFGNYCCHLWLTLLNIHSRDMARPPLASFLFADLWMMFFVVGSMFCATRKYFWEVLLESDFLYVVVSWVVYFRNSF